MRHAYIALRVLIVAPLLFVLASDASAQRPPDMRLDAGTNRQIVERVIDAVEKYYASEDVAGQVASLLRQRLSEGAFDAIVSAYDLLTALDAALLEGSKDPHMKLGYENPGSPDAPEIAIETPQEREQERVAAQADNFGFVRLERLPGNVGYIELSRFVRPEFAGEMTGLAMRFVQGADALIIDVRSSRGGSPEMVQMLVSYFFPGENPVHYGDLRVRVEDRTKQLWTFPYVPGPRFLDKPVYILTSRRTFSAPEGLAKFLQSQRKATVVGEATRGGTRPGLFVRVHSNFAVFVPVGLASFRTGEEISVLGRPVLTQSQIEPIGVGVKPDVQVSADDALRMAHLTALTRQLEGNPSATWLEPLIANLQKKAPASENKDR